MKQRVLLMMMIIAVGIVVSCKMGTKKSNTTVNNLNVSIAGEIAAGVKYSAFAEKAREEGYPKIAIIFDALSKSEGVHAANHMDVLTSLGVKMDSINPVFEVKSTMENLEAAINGESYESKTMYPDFIKSANEEKVANAVQSFTWAMNTEKKHEVFYEMALREFINHNMAKLPAAYYVCPECGNTFVTGFKNKRCPFCNTLGEQFIAVSN
jgi:rubrerythrin